MLNFIKVKDVKSPVRGTEKSAGIDFFVPQSFRSCNVNPACDMLIPSGIKVKVPEGFALVAFNKSGVATKKQLIKGAEVVDEDYQGEIHIHVINTGTKPVRISAGDKLIQFILLPVGYDMPNELPSEEELYGGVATERGTGGFGHTDMK